VSRLRFDNRAILTQIPRSTANAGVLLERFIEFCNHIPIVAGAFSIFAVVLPLTVGASM
jgi:hypothetical protein